MGFLRTLLSFAVVTVMPHAGGVSGHRHGTQNGTAGANSTLQAHTFFDGTNCDRQFHLGSCFINTEPCDKLRALAHRQKYLRSEGQVLICTAFPSIGNLMGHLRKCVSAALEMDLSLVIDTRSFGGLDMMLEPNLLDYHWGPDVDALLKDGSMEKTELRSLGKHNVVIFPTSKASEYANLQAFNPKTANNFRGCALNGLFRWTPFAVSEYYRHVSTRPSIGNLGSYWVWHIRTSYGEEHRFDPSVHHHVLNLNTVSQNDICLGYDKVHNGSSGTVYISTNFPEIISECIRLLPHIHFESFADRAGGHTGNDNSNHSAAVTAFEDLMVISRAKGIIHTGSSFVASMVVPAFSICPVANRSPLVNDRSIRTFVNMCRHF